MLFQESVQPCIELNILLKVRNHLRMELVEALIILYFVIFEYISPCR